MKETRSANEFETAHINLVLIDYPALTQAQRTAMSAPLQDWSCSMDSNGQLLLRVLSSTAIKRLEIHCDFGCQFYCKRRQQRSIRICSPT
jgi:hypothetical protein